MNTLRATLLLFSLPAFSISLDPALVSALNDENSTESLTIVLQLKGRFNLGQFNARELAKLDQRSRGKVVAQTLRQFHEASAKEVRRFISSPEGQGITDVASLWAVNVLRVTGTKEAIEKLLALTPIDSAALEVPREIDDVLDFNATWWPRALNSLPQMGWGIEKLGVPQVWEHANQGSGALVAVIDTGANLKHPDLAPSLWKNPGETGRDSEGGDKATNGVDDDQNGYNDDIVGWNFDGRSNDLTDEIGHGSATAGIVAGNGAAGTRTGVAPKATVMVLKSCCRGSNKLFESNTWEAIQYAIENGAKIISMSLSVKPFARPTYAKWRELGEVELAAGVIHVNSAGNLGGGREPHNMGAPSSNPPAWFHASQTPGGMTSMITVGATDKSDKVRRYSSRGPVTWEGVEGYDDYPYDNGSKPGLIKPEVCGPSEVPTLAKEGKGYAARDFGGTSSATPHIAGVVALLVSHYPDLTPTQATEALVSSAQAINTSGYDNNCGAGRVDAWAALEYVKAKFVR